MASTQINDGYKIVISLGLTNKAYKANVEAEGLTFQNVVYHIRFLNEISSGGVINTNQETVVPIVKVINQDGIVLRGENAVLDAGDSYITNRPQSLMQEGLTFSWICPLEILALCQGKTGKRLEITEDQFKASRGKYGLTYVILSRVEWSKKSGV
jgi:hypothetical protein